MLCETLTGAIDSNDRLRPGMFVGKSMEPAIPKDSYYLFRAPIIGTPLVARPLQRMAGR